MLIFIFNAIKIIFLLGFLILIHEGGHFLVAKLFKVKVNEFSIGFGKQLLSKQKGETVYSLRMIPLGGYVSMLGEEERSEDERSFSKQSIPKRIAIVAAGGLVNILFGLLVYFVLLATLGNFVSKTVDSVIEEYGAANAGIVAGDEIISIDGKRVFISNDVNSILSKTGDKEVSIKIKRNGEKQELRVTPTEVKTKTLGIYLEKDEGKTTTISYIADDSSLKNILKVGDTILTINGQNVENNYEELINQINNSVDTVTLNIRRDGNEQEIVVTPDEITNYYLGVVFKPADKKFFTRIYYAWFETGDFALSLVDNVKELFTGGVSVNQMMGPIGISKTVASTNGIYEFVYIMSLISLSLGITNLLPIPALDGGKILILLIEAIRRKPMKQEFETGIQLAGFGLLILLSIYISYLDITRIL